MEIRCRRMRRTAEDRPSLNSFRGLELDVGSEVVDRKGKESLRESKKRAEREGEVSKRV